jgi:hypothetical protein
MLKLVKIHNVYLFILSQIFKTSVRPGMKRTFILAIKTTDGFIALIILSSSLINIH